MTTRKFSGLALVFLAFAVGVKGAVFTVDGSKCEYRVNPEGIDEAQPRLSWLMESKARGVRQAAYEILVASSAEKLAQDKGDLWDSGKVESRDSVNVEYKGKELASRKVCYWKVRVWDEQGSERTSDPARWSMGFLKPEDWQADYITFRDTTPLWTNRNKVYLPQAHQLRKEFIATRAIKRATIYATALGIFELHVNGQRVGDALFAPGWTDYHQRAYYNTYDVTSLVTVGGNAIGAWLADGWYAGYLGFGMQNGYRPEHSGRDIYGKTPALMAQLEIEYSDGSRLVVPTDNSWRVSGDGPIREGDFLMGETYDAQRETPGWTSTAFDDEKWEKAILASENGSCPTTFYEDTNGEKPDDDTPQKGHPVDVGFQRPPKLEAFPGVPVRATEEIKPATLTEVTNGVFIFDMAQNFAGVVRLKVKGQAGTKIRLRYGEQLHKDGTLMTENLRKARATDYYILRGDPNGEVYTPRFTFHGFQYVELTGFPGRPNKGTITGVVIGSDTPLTSAFECHDPVVNRLFKNIVWTQRANFVDIPTDCPQRDERFGWMGDAQVYAHCATLNADVGAFYTKWLRELMEAQRPSGTFPGYCPYPFQSGWDFGTAWCDAGIIVPWTVWQAYGDTRIIERCWAPMTRFMEWRKNTSKDYLGVKHGNDWGDWLSFGLKTPIEYVDTVYYADNARKMTAMAEATGKETERAAYQDLFDKIKAAFGAKYLKPDGSLTVDNETAYALALTMDLIPSELRAKSGRILADKLRAGETAKASGVQTGFLGTRPLLPVLTSLGNDDLAAHIFQSHKFPSWGYEVEQGATTIWERWNGYTKEYGFEGPDGSQNASMNSFAHYAFGAVGEWMINDLAGIQAGNPGYAEIVIDPHPPTPEPGQEPKPIEWVKARYDSDRGRIESEWKREKSKFYLTVTIPPNTTATIYMPGKNAEEVREGGFSLRDARVRVLATNGDRVVLAVGSGTYRLQSRL